nr:MAG TPA: hypothetical protein [Caudoviricetes sp.]
MRFWGVRNVHHTTPDTIRHCVLCAQKPSGYLHSYKPRAKKPVKNCVIMHLTIHKYLIYR